MVESNTDQKPLDILILAAGLGTRMRSEKAKVLHEVNGRPLIQHVCRTAAALDPRTIYIVVGHQSQEVEKAVLDVLPATQTRFVKQERQLGTGDAVNAARKELEDRSSTLLILSGDVPLIRAETLASLIRQHETHRAKGAACTVLAVKLKDPTGYGRVVRDAEGRFEKIVEQKDASEAEAAITEINAGIYCFETSKLFQQLSMLNNDNAQGEYYLTDVPQMLRSAGEDVSIFQHSDAQEIEGINNRVQLAEVEDLLRRRTIAKLMLDYGVTFVDPRNVYISEDANIGKDTLIYPNVSIEGTCEVGAGCTVRSGTRISNSVIGDGVEILDHTIIVDSEVSSGCTVGPFAHLRGKAKMLNGAKVGNFVELKKTTLGSGSKANHLAYLGDATIGDKTNIGAGTITCNYDGVNKHPTVIGSGVKIGSDTMLIAPVTVGDGASTGAGSIVTKDVEPGVLVAGVPAKPLKKLEKDPKS